MKKTLKKVVSFMLTAVITASLFTGALTSSAAGITATRKLTDKYDIAVAAENMALFADCKTGKTITSTTDIKILKSNGKLAALKNTIGFDSVYSSFSYGISGFKAEQVTESAASSTPFILVGKGGKYAAILSNGKYLNSGKYYDQIVKYEDFIVTLSGTTYTFFTQAGKKAFTADTSTKFSYTKEADSADGTGVIGVTKDEESYTYYAADGTKLGTYKWTEYGYFRYIVHYSDKSSTLLFNFSDTVNVLSSKGKLLNTVTLEPLTDIKCAKSTDGHDYAVIYARGGESSTITAAFGSDGMVMDKLPKFDSLVYVHSPRGDYENNEYKVSVPDGDNKCNVTDSDGKVVYTFTPGIYYHKNSLYYGEKSLYIASIDGFVSISLSSGKVTKYDTKTDYFSIDYVSEDEKTFVLSTAKKSSYGDYEVAGVLLFSVKAKKALTSVYKDLAPLGSTNIENDPTVYDKQMIYDANGSFFFRDGDKYGLISSTGKILAKATFDKLDEQFSHKGATVFRNGNNCTVMNSLTGKLLYASTFHISHKLAINLKDFTYIITGDYDKNNEIKYGLILVK